MDNIIIPLGILTYTMLLITIVSGIRRINMQHHKMLAFTTIALATIHAAVVIYSFILGD
jgi:hypothetical protein